MRHKNKRLKIIATLTIIAALCLFTIAYADETTDEEEGHSPGEMIINTSAIYDTRVVMTSHHSAIGHELVPFLFLEDMEENEQRRLAQNEAALTTMREDLFLMEEVERGVDTSELTAGLFLNEETTTNRTMQRADQINYFEIPTWVMIIGVTLMTGILAYAAVILGKKVSHVIHKKKEKKANG